MLASKDGHLICFHDVTLDATTDVVNRTEFAHRKRTYEVQGAKVTGWFVGMWITFFVVILKISSMWIFWWLVDLCLLPVDFTLKELKSLRVKQRFSFRDQRYNGILSLHFLSLFHCIWQPCLFRVDFHPLWTWMQIFHNAFLLDYREIPDYYIWGVYLDCALCGQDSRNIPWDQKSSFHQPACK